MKASVVVALCLAAPVVYGAGTEQAKEGIAVIVNPGTPLKEADSAALKALYLGQTSAIGGTALIPVDQAAGAPVRQAFVKLVLQMEPDDLTKHWKSQRFLGFADAQPASLTASEVKKFVARRKGAIGYVPFSSVDATVAVVARVNGKAISASAIASGEYPYVFQP